MLDTCYMCTHKCHIADVQCISKAASLGINPEFSLESKPVFRLITQWLISGAFNHQLLVTSPLCAKKYWGRIGYAGPVSQQVQRFNGSQDFGIVPHCLGSTVKPL